MPKTEAAEARRKMPTDLEFVSGKEEDWDEVDDEEADDEEAMVDCAFSSVATAETLPAREPAGGA